MVVCNERVMENGKCGSEGRVRVHAVRVIFPNRFVRGLASREGNPILRIALLRPLRALFAPI
jgi:hypothetical protein